MRNTVTAFGTLSSPPTSIEVTNNNGAPIRSIRVDNYTQSYYFVVSINQYIPPLTRNWSHAYDKDVTRETIGLQAPPGYVQNALPPNTPTQIIVEVSDDTSLQDYGAPFGAQIGPRIGTAQQPIPEIAIPGIVTVDITHVGGGVIGFTVPVDIASQSIGPITVSGTVSISGTVTVTGTVTANPPTATNSTTTSVAGSAAAVTLLAANANRKGAIIANDSTAILYVLLGSGVPSSTNYTYQMAGSTATGISHLEIPFAYTGIIKGIWASATGNARVTEITP